MEEIEDTVIKDPTAGVFKEQKLRPARPSIPTQKEEQNAVFFLIYRKPGFLAKH